ncbi:C45 family peptidase [Cloacibacillus evryensis]|uniref:C45 family autoproteolytic acyltransferase/hydolase n=1 Tax=Cloacibacillus evryensis TaxID=508460 RepID=UPI00210E7119|nr:C45 family peptidase [Cloacibacillus evryensis]MCQ4763942.1 C45 family peptidase [Cloacibacillus evryensis]
MDKFTLVKIKSADPFERGLQYGLQAAAQIRGGIENYKRHFLARNLSWEEIGRRSAQYLPLLEKECPAELTEARGIARGAGVELEEVMALNCRYELLKDKPKECTSTSVLTEATGSDKVYLAQNWDYRPWVMENAVIISVDNEEGTRILGISEAGQLVRNGFNSHGVGICANNLTSTLDGGDPGIPVTFLRRQALNSKNFKEAERLIYNGKRSVSCNYMLASGEDIAADLETTPQKVFRVDPEDGIVTHANHFVAGARYCTGTDHKFRDKVLRKLLMKNRGHITKEVLFRALSDHETFPGAADTYPQADCIEALCTHLPKGEPDPNGVWQTIASVVYDLRAGSAYICKGTPCCGEYLKYDL